MSVMIFHRNSWLALIVQFLLVGGTQAVNEPLTFDDLQTGSYIKEWLVCGPFPNDSRRIGSISLEDYASNGFYQDFLGPTGGESNADPQLGESFSIQELNREYIWKELRSEDDLVSFENFFEENDNVVAYAYTRIESPKSQRAILSVGSNDGIRIFLNGALVHSHLILRWLGKDTDYVPITLNKGTNKLLIKVDESGGDWGFSARLLDYEETLRSIRENIEEHSKLRVVTREENLTVFFGEPYKLETLNPGTRVQVDAMNEDGDLVARLSGRCGKPIEFPLTAFEDGPLRFKATFPLGEGRVIESERGHYVGALPRHKLPAMIGEDLAFRKEGEPFLPIGIYSARPEEYADLKAAGFNFVVAGVGNLDQVHEAGLMASVGFHGDDTAYLKHLEETVEQYKDHPAVLCWMLADEPGYNQMDLLNMHKAYKLVHEIDPVHPSYLVITDPRVYETFGRCCDVLAIDTYPISKKFPINDVGFNIAKAYSELNRNLPVWHCGQLFAWPSDRLPTQAENRFMNYLALADGAKGLLWYGMHWYGTSLPEEDPELWKAHRELVQEVKLLERFFIAPGLGTELEVEDPKSVTRANIKKTMDGEQLVIALNTSREISTEATIPIDGDTVEVVGEDRQIEVMGGSISDRFEPLSVHLYWVR